jgi:hypothetical protein
MKNLYVCITTQEDESHIIDWIVSEMNLKEIQEEMNTWIVEQVPIEIIEEVIDSYRLEK